MSQYVTAVANHVTLIAFSEVTFGMNLRRHISRLEILAFDILSQFHIKSVYAYVCSTVIACNRPVHKEGIPYDSI